MLLAIDMLYIFLGSLVLIFLLIVFAYYMVRIDKKNKIVNADFIHGTWQRKGKSPEGEPWSFSYQFEKDKFWMDGDPAYHLSGNYKIIKELENLLRVELFNLKGDVEAPRQLISISVDKKSNKLNINGKDFLKVKS